MPRRELPPLSIEADDVRCGRVDPHYRVALIRLLAAHAMAEKLTALGYERALASLTDEALRVAVAKKLAEERHHASLVYRVLRDLGVSQQEADRATIPMLKAPSFEAPLRFARGIAGELDLTIAALSLDMTGLLMIGINYKESSYAPHARAAERILQDDAENKRFAAGEFTDAVARFGADAVSDALCRWLPATVNFFGPPGSGFSYECLCFGLKACDNKDLAEMYLSMLERRLEPTGVAIPPLTKGYPRALSNAVPGF
ncbi:MAG TPA: hypothetical protein VNF45_02300 [Candidatus Binataceae bacterium]|nr:hypothetical protein [Candidatus Binataceae bacterium]